MRRSVRFLLVCVAQLVATAHAAEPIRDCPLCPALAVVPGGTFELGSPPGEVGREPREGPRREVEIAAFALGVAEVTRGEYAAFVAATGYPGGSGCWVHDGLSWSEREGFGWENPGFPQTDADPVVCVNADDVSFYLLWLGRLAGHRYRLPTEAEWEYAARAGSDTRFPHGADPEYAELCEHANGPGQEAGFEYRNQACRDPFAFTAPPEAFPANGFGLRNMLGNALEWTDSCYTPSHAENAPEDCRYRVLRGGNWAGAPEHLRPAARGLNPPSARWSTNGFRVARDLTPS
jgi:formylglycine-generating enzyme required for sulfatase activity